MKVMQQFPLSDEEPIDEFLDLIVALLGIIKNLADVVDGTLDSLGVARLFPFNHEDCADHMVCGRDVEKHAFVFPRSCKDGWRGQVLFELCEGLVSFVRPHKRILCFEQLEEGKSFLAQSGNETAQGSHASRKFLDVFDTLWCL